MLEVLVVLEILVVLVVLVVLEVLDSQWGHWGHPHQSMILSICKALHFYVNLIAEKTL